MPRGDKTGPVGLGPMSGHAAGTCAGYGMPGFANPVPGRGYGMGFGRGGGFGGGGRGWRHWSHATGLPGWMRFGAYPPAPSPFAEPKPEMEKQALKRQSEILQSGLDFIKKRLGEIETETASE